MVKTNWIVLGLLALAALASFMSIPDAPARLPASTAGQARLGIASLVDGPRAPSGREG